MPRKECKLLHETNISENTNKCWVLNVGGGMEIVLNNSNVMGIKNCNYVCLILNQRFNLIITCVDNE